MYRRLFYIGSFLLVLLAGSCSKESLEAAPIAHAPNNPVMEQEMMGLVNDHRVSLGYAPLAYSAVAYEYASEHTDYMIAKGSLSHDNFSARASSISREVDAEYVAENVAKDYTEVQQAFQSWLNSPSHRKTMEGEFTHTAVSVKIDASGNYYYTELFFRQASASQ